MSTKQMIFRILWIIQFFLIVCLMVLIKKGENTYVNDFDVFLFLVLLMLYFVFSTMDATIGYYGKLNQKEIDEIKRENHGWIGVPYLLMAKICLLSLLGFAVIAFFISILPIR